MGRVKILSSEPRTATVDMSAGLIKYIIPIDGEEVGNFIKAEKKDKEIVIYYQRIIKPEEPTVDPVNKTFIITF